MVQILFLNIRRISWLHCKYSKARIGTAVALNINSSFYQGDSSSFNLLRILASSPDLLVLKKNGPFVTDDIIRIDVACEKVALWFCFDFCVRF